MPLASLSCENNFFIIMQIKLISSQEMFCTWPRYKSDGFWNAEMAYFPVTNNCCSVILSLFCKHVSLVTGPGNWTGICKNGTRQSPIAIQSADTRYDENLGSFILKNYDSVPNNVNLTFKNNGHCITITGFPPLFYKVSGGGLLDVYTTAQLNLHWGSDNTKGSEHTLDGKQFAAEVSEWKTY